MTCDESIMGEGTAHTADAIAEVLEGTQLPHAAAQAILEVAITVPISDVSLDNCHIRTHIDVQSLSRNQGTVLRRLQLALDNRGAKLANGRRVVTPPDAIRWLLEEIGANRR